ncbi:Imm58 family immunity protein [Acidovorax sp. SUPP2539]|uniref:Imm58 family immunity protein n=1 Tax=Acidovorax sp. SUPP2539 TaxID=2920878 RepID=UPI0023DE43ED|nr:Imm58 family immunity protein [Acidovorax sp. SUPP2539]GKS87688.1 immunity protein 58 [Acidovorax sp. SUPP2539]
MKLKLMIFALMLALIGCAVFAYLWIDRSITLNYVRQSGESSNESNRRLERLLEAAWIGMPEKSVIDELQLQVIKYPAESIVIKKEDGVVWFGEIPFNFEHGRLKSVGGH